MGDLEDRQSAALVIGSVFMIAIPVLILLALLFVTGWLYTLGTDNNIHATIWGWLSNRRENGSWSVGRIVPTYFLSVFSAYLGYQIAELLNSGFQMFRRALT